MKNLGFRFSDTSGNVFGTNSQKVSDVEFRKRQEQAIDQMKIGAEAMNCIASKYNVQDPSELIAILANFVLSFYVTEATAETKDLKQIEAKLDILEKKANAIVDGVMKFSPDGPEEGMATLALAFNGLYYLTQEAIKKVETKAMKENQSKPYDIIAEIEKSIREKYGK